MASALVAQWQRVRLLIWKLRNRVLSWVILFFSLGITNSTLELFWTRLLADRLLTLNLSSFQAGIHTQAIIGWVSRYPLYVLLCKYSLSFVSKSLLGIIVSLTKVTSYSMAELTLSTVMFVTMDGWKMPHGTWAGKGYLWDRSQWSPSHWKKQRLILPEKWPQQ